MYTTENQHEHLHFGFMQVFKGWWTNVAFYWIQNYLLNLTFGTQETLKNMKIYTWHLGDKKLKEN